MENVFMIYGTPHIVKGITNERVIFQALKSDSYYNNPSYKIKFHSYKGYYITIPQEGYGGGYKDISLVDIFKSFEMYNKLKRVEQLRGEFI